MAQIATVKDLLASLDYGKRTVEQDIITELHTRFNVPSGHDLNQALQSEAPGRILAELLNILRPFAFMIQDVYGFLADAAVRTEGNLEIQVPLDEANSLNLDLNRFRQFEQSIVEQVAGSKLDTSFLPSTGRWRQVSDGYWPPRCVLQSRAGETIERCIYCDESRVTDFERLTNYYEALHQSDAEDLKYIFHGQWDEYKERSLWSQKQCVLENEWSRNYFETALKEFEAATRSYTVEDIRKFLALPYWKQRWQFYEVWFVMLVLRSYGLSNLELHNRDQKWELAVGSVMHHPIATSRLRDGNAVEFYYQHQGVPPTPLFPDTVDRPELLVWRKDSKDSVLQRLLVAEVKARQSFSTQDMEGALFALLKWDTRAIVGANYFNLGSGQNLVKQITRGVEIVAGNECTPRSSTATELSEWLGSFWKRELGLFVDIILIDTSASMPAAELPKVVGYVRTTLSKTPTSELLVATFSSSTQFYPSDALDNRQIDLAPKGGTDLSHAISDCRDQLQQQFPEAGQLAVHIITDLSVSQDDLSKLSDWVLSKDVALHIYTWRNDEVKNLLRLFPGFEDTITYL